MNPPGMETAINPLPNRVRFSQGVFWLSIVVFMLLGLAALMEVQPNDFWWYLRVARDTLTAGAVPQVDTLSYTHVGEPVVYHSWLSALIFYLIYQVGGVSWIVVLRILVLLATLVLLWYIMFRAGLDPILSAGLLFAAGLTTSNNWMVIRPQMFVIPLFVLTIYILDRWGENNNRIVWFLPIISLLWVNLHGSFILMVLLLIPALIFGKGERKSLIFAFVVSVLLFMVHPHGVGVWEYLWFSVTTPRLVDLYEWDPPINLGWQMNLFFGWVLAFTPLAALSPGRLSRRDWVWFLGFGWIAFSGLRYVIWFTLLIAIWTGRLLASWDFQPSKYVKLNNPKLNFGLAGFFFVLPIFMLPGVRDHWWAEAPAALPTDTPVAAIAWLAEHPDLPGEVWVDLGFSSYLPFALPSRPVGLDTRFVIIYTHDDVVDYLTVADADPGWDELLRRNDVNMVFSSYHNTELISILQDSADWCHVYQDDVAIIFVRPAADDICIDG